jgi:integrase
MVYTNSMGMSGDHDRQTKEFDALLSRTGLREPRFHDLLHTAATLMLLMLRDGLPVHVVSAVLGHSQATATLSVYAHVLSGANERTADTMERLL